MEPMTSGVGRPGAGADRGDAGKPERDKNRKRVRPGGSSWVQPPGDASSGVVDPVEETPDAGVNDADAEAIIRDILRQYFTDDQIGELVPILMAEIRNSEQIVEARIWGLIRSTNVYKQRFAGMEIRRGKGLNAISESEYLALERYYMQTMRAAGLPLGFYDSPNDFASLIGNDVSAAEFSQRIQVGYLEVQNAPEDVKQELRSRYGMTDGEMLSWFLDEDVALPLIERQVATAKMGAAASRAGIGAIDTQSLERLVRMGIVDSQGAQGFARIAGDQELFRPLDAGEDPISMGDAIDATFTGNAAAARRIRQRRERRLAEFDQGGGYAGQGSERTGLAGV